MDRGERLSDATIADYRQQLDNVERNQERLEELIRAIWSQVEQ